MNSHLKRFITQYLSVVFSTLLSVSFFAFLAIPFSLGNHPGDERISQGSMLVTASEPRV